MSQAHSLMAYTTHKNCKIGDGGSFVFLIYQHYAQTPWFARTATLRVPCR